MLLDGLTANIAMCNICGVVRNCRKIPGQGRDYHEWTRDCEAHGEGDILDQQLVEVERPAKVIVRRRHHERDDCRSLRVDTQEGVYIASPQHPIGQTARDRGDRQGCRTTLVGALEGRPAFGRAPPWSFAFAMMPSLLIFVIEIMKEMATRGKQFQDQV